ncbi:helix-turn-helix transcriptional regulator [Bacillus halotolerans]|uniref:helix-turn-helix transcriptional regulator n=1 Tax=Bacillus halotolerans TaxID=260554 RepID=UPI00404B1C17
MATKRVYQLMADGAEKIELHLLRENMTQTEFSKSIKVSPSYVSQIMNKKIKVTAKTALKITRALHKESIRELFTMSTENEKEEHLLK